MPGKAGPLGIIAAGGLGRRFGGDRPKNEIDLLGRPMVSYVLEAFQASEEVLEVVLVLPPHRLEHWPLSRLRELGFGKVRRVIAGGASRQQSVRRGLDTIEEVDRTVVVHDGARPLVTPGLIDSVCDIPEGAEGVVTAVPVIDTIKEIDGASVVRTLPRDKLVTVQTPQGFRLDSLRKAHRKAEEDGFVGTDDASLVERAGGMVFVTEGSRDNIKVTFAEDVGRAEEILRRRSNH